ncbi:MAG: hypothetical protein R6U94_08945 [Nitriliruptoraceae bacterium]
MLIRAATNGALSEIGVLDIDGDDQVAIHAKPVRRRISRFLTRG